MSKVNFRTNVLLKSIIGKDLITDDNIAVLELVKNSFDSGSNEVIIEFINLKEKKNSKLLIRDFGSGMSEDDLTNKWLNIAYSAKKEKREEYGRILAGNKGVGRFSCDRLGRYLNIYTKKSNDNYIKLHIDWKWFEVEGNINLNIQDIEIEIESLNEADFISKSGYLPFKKGTLLEICDLRNIWDYNKTLSLKRQLERLINPNQSFKSSPFKIIMKVNEFLNDEIEKQDYEKINGDVKNRIFENLNFKTTSIDSNIDENGNTITTVLKDRGIEIFKLTEKNRFNLLKNVNVNIYYLNPYSKAYFTKQTGIRSVNFGSIFLFINGFRIPPYGDEGDDWLGMESRKGQGYSRYLGTREVVGRIEIADSDENFKIISSRSGVINNETFNQLTKSDSPFGYYYKIFRRLERFVNEGIKWDSTNEDERKLELKVLNDPDWHESKENYIEDSFTRNKRVLQVVENIIDSKKDDIIKLIINDEFIETLIEEQKVKINDDLIFIAEQIENKKLNPNELAKVLEKINYSRDELKVFTDLINPYKENFDSFTNEIDKELKVKYDQLKIEKELIEKKLEIEEKERQKIEQELENEKQKNTYLLATRRTISPDADGLIHNIKLNSSNIISYINTLSLKIKNNEIGNSKILEYIGKIAIEAEKSLTISKLITRADLQKELHKKPINIPKYIEQYCEHYNDLYDRVLKTSIKSNVSEYSVICTIIDLSLIFDNLFSNAQKWGASEIFIEINENENEELIIIVNDNGNGLVDSFKNIPSVIFELGVNETSPNSLGYGGSGIGLFTIKTILEDKDKNLKGDIIFLRNNYKLKGASFKITLKNKYKNAELSNN
jgi:signal transduction histidine kinase